MRNVMTVNSLALACGIFVASFVASGAASAGTSPLLKNFTGSAPPERTFPSVPGKHPARCKYLGTWNDSLGGTYVEKSKSVGTYTNPSCSFPFTVVVTSFTKAGVTVEGTNTGSDECIPSFEVTGTFSDCSDVSGNFNNGFGNFPYSATKDCANCSANHPDALSGGLK